MIPQYRLIINLILKNIYKFYIQNENMSNYIEIMKIKQYNRGCMAVDIKEIMKK